MATNRYTRLLVIQPSSRSLRFMDKHSASPRKFYIFRFVGYYCVVLIIACQFMLVAALLWNPPSKTQNFESTENIPKRKRANYSLQSKATSLVGHPRKPERPFTLTDVPIMPGINMVRNQDSPLIFIYGNDDVKGYSTVYGWSQSGIVSIPDCKNLPERVNCRITSEQKYLPQASAIRANAFGSIDPLTARYRIANNQLSIAFTLEGPGNHQKLQDPKHMSRFNALTSFRLDSDVPCPMVRPDPKFPILPFEQRANAIIAVYSNCESIRTLFLNTYNRVASSIFPLHSYGSCANTVMGSTVFKTFNGELLDIGKRYKGGFMDKKVEVMRHYKFTFVIPNQDCDYFIDEKLTHAWQTGSVPVFLGTRKLPEFLHGPLQRSVIKVSDFNKKHNCLSDISALS